RVSGQEFTRKDRAETHAHLCKSRKTAEGGHEFSDYSEKGNQDKVGSGKSRKTDKKTARRLWGARCRATRVLIPPSHCDQLLFCSRCSRFGLQLVGPEGKAPGRVALQAHLVAHNGPAARVASDLDNGPDTAGVGRW